MLANTINYSHVHHLHLPRNVSIAHLLELSCLLLLSNLSYIGIPPLMEYLMLEYPPTIYTKAQGSRRHVSMTCVQEHA